MKKVLFSSNFENFIFFIFFLVISIMMFLDGLDRELLVCQRGEKVLNHCEIYRLVPWQKTSIKQFPLSYLKEAVVKEPRWFHSEDALICILVTEEGELPFGSRFGGDEQEKHQWASEINIFLKNKGQLNLSIQESFNYSLFFWSFLFIIFDSFVVYSFISSLDFFRRKRHLFKSRKRHLFKGRNKKSLKSQEFAQILVTTAINKKPLNSYDVPIKFTILSSSPTLVIQFYPPSGINWFSFGIIFGLFFPWVLQIIQQFSIEEPWIWFIRAFMLWVVCLAIYSLMLGLFGKTEVQAFPERLIIKDKLFSIVIQETIISKSSLLYFEKHGIYDSESEQISTWKLHAVTNRSKIELLSDNYEKNCCWLGITLADFYQVEFKQNSNEKID